MSEGDVDGGQALCGGSAHDTGGSTEAWRGPEVEREETEGQVTVRHGAGGCSSARRSHFQGSGTACLASGWHLSEPCCYCHFEKLGVRRTGKPRGWMTVKLVVIPGLTEVLEHAVPSWSER